MTPAGQYGHAPFAGDNLVRLLYLDESGTDRAKAPALCVAGVLIHGDKEYPEVERRILALIEKHIPEEDRRGFVFHATDIFHGARYFDRRKPEWEDRERRHAILCDLALIVEDLALPVMAGRYHREGFGEGHISFSGTAEKEVTMHNTAAFDCLVHAERWLERFAPDELARVTHEDGTPAKAMIKQSVRAFRDPNFPKVTGMDEEFRIEYGLPLKRIVDSVSFEDKRDARPLQLADLCAFIFGRITRQASVPEPAAEILTRHAGWTLILAKEAKERASSLAGAPPA